MLFMINYYNFLYGISCRRVNIRRFYDNNNTIFGASTLLIPGININFDSGNFNDNFLLFYQASINKYLRPNIYYSAQYGYNISNFDNSINMNDSSQYNQHDPDLSMIGYLGYCLYEYKIENDNIPQNEIITNSGDKIIAIATNQKRVFNDVIGNQKSLQDQENNYQDIKFINAEKNQHSIIDNFYQIIKNSYNYDKFLRYDETLKDKELLTSESIKKYHQEKNIYDKSYHLNKESEIIKKCRIELEQLISDKQAKIVGEDYNPRIRDLKIARLIRIISEENSKNK